MNFIYKYIKNIKKLTNKDEFVNNNLNKYKIFNDAFLINLDSRNDKLEYCTNELQKVNIKFKKFSGIIPKTKGFFDVIGAKGCYESHRQILLNNICNEYPILIMEDDISFTNEFNKINDYINSIPNDYDILYFYCLNNINNKSKWIRSKTSGTHFYIVNNKSIIKILKQIDHHIKNQRAIDSAYMSSDLITYCTTQQLVLQNISKLKSDINIKQKIPKRLKYII